MGGRACLECSASMEDFHPNARRCSSECKKAHDARGRRQPPTPPRECAFEQCSNIVDRPSPRAKYCADTCNQKAHYYRNHAAMIERMADYREGKEEYFSTRAKANKARRLAADPAYADVLRIKAREDYQKHGEARRATVRAWGIANPAERSLHSIARRARERDAKRFAITAADWERMKRRTNQCCTYCGERSDELQKEHVIPLSRGGDHSIGNLVPACPTCNFSKNARLLIEWRMSKIREAHYLKSKAS